MTWTKASKTDNMLGKYGCFSSSNARQGQSNRWNTSWPYTHFVLNTANTLSRFWWIKWYQAWATKLTLQIIHGKRSRVQFRPRTNISHPLMAAIKWRYEFPTNNIYKLEDEDWRPWPNQQNREINEFEGYSTLKLLIL